MLQYSTIICSPNHEDRFILCSARRIRLCQTVNRSPTTVLPSSNQILNDELAVQETKERQLPENATAFAWYPTSDSSGSTSVSPDHLIAIGDSNGRVVLTSLEEVNLETDPCELSKMEFMPRQTRPCSFLQWNPFRKNLLAQGLDRSRSAKDGSILVWDVNEPIIPTPMGEHLPGTTGGLSRPSTEIAASESISSFAWIGPSAFVAGVGGKLLRIYDLPSTIRCSATTKAVHGLCFDMQSKNMIASYQNCQVSVWMLPKMDRHVAVLSVGQEHQVLQIAWCPTRSGYLAVLAKDSRSVLVFDTVHLSPGGNSDEPFQPMTERRVVISAAGSPHQLVSLAWLPSTTGAFLCIDSSGQLHFRRLLEHITLAFSPADNKLLWARGSDMGETSGPALEADIGPEMRRLALRNYGLDLERSLAACAALFPEDDHRHRMWQWLEHLCALVRPLTAEREVPGMPGGGKALRSNAGSISSASNASSARSLSSATSASGASSSQGSPYLLGVRGTLSMSSLQGSGAPVAFCSRSERAEVPWRATLADQLPLRVVNAQWRSEERQRVLRLCQMAPDTLPGAIEALRHACEFERAACLALLHLDFGLALDILRRGAEHHERSPGGAAAAVQGAGQSGLNLELIALALTGFSDERNRVWQSVTRELLPRLHHPYLRLMFMFIAAESAEDLGRCAEVPGIRVADRIALAALYLSDKKLRNFVEQLTCECIGKASLEGLILTGLGGESLELLQSYLDRTGDVQTVSLVCLLGQHLRSPSMLEDKRPNCWASAYRDILDGWRLWSHRAAFDIQRQACDPRYKAPPQIYVACGYCGGKVAQAVQSGSTAAARRYPGGSSAAASGKTSICQACRKPLPRCAICLMHTGTAAGMLGVPRAGANAPRAVPMDRWFVWCLKCRHGGHTAHIARWFKDNRDCPVSGCPCTCAELDRTSLSAVESMTQ